MDKEVLREIWHGQLPLCFKLYQDDICGMHSPEPYYMLVPRITYFPLILDRVIRYFNRFIDQNKQDLNELWLEFDGQPIKWQHPIGLSWDLLGSTYNLPWTLVLHFSDFPAKELVRCNTKASIRTNFMYSLKEADAMKHKGAVIMNIVEKDLNQMWSSLQNDKFDQFWRINSRLMETSTDNKLFKNIPYRMYFPDYTYIQKSIRPSLEPETTMSDLIEITFMDRMDEMFEYKFVTHGIEIPLKSPLQWLSEHLSYPDNFLHIVALPKQPNDQ